MAFRSARGRLLLLLTFFFAGALFVSLGALLPEGNSRRIAITVLGVLFAAAYLVVLVSRIRNLFAGFGKKRVEVVLALVNVAVLLSAFAAIYAALGIMDNTGQETVISHDFGNCLYYSVVTFTTLGYGDFEPRDVGRVMAALQAFVGFTVLGILASTSAQLIQDAAKDQKDAEEN